MKNLGRRNCVLLAALIKPRLAWRWFRMVVLRRWAALLRPGGEAA